MMGSFGIHTSLILSGLKFLYTTPDGRHMLLGAQDICLLVSDLLGNNNMTWV